MSSDKVTAAFYAVLVPESYNYSGTPYVTGIRLDRTRSAKPALKKGEIAVRVKLNFDKQSLIDAIPAVSADVPAFTAYQPEPTDIETAVA